MIVGLWVAFILISIVLGFYAFATTLSAENGKAKRKYVIILWISMCISIGLAVAFGNMHKSDKTQTYNAEFQEKLIDAYKKNYGQDEDISNYEKFIKDYNKNK